MKQKFPFLTNENIISVKKSPYSETIEYIIEVQEPTGQQTSSLTIFNKEKNKPEILASNPVKISKPVP